MGSSCAGDTPLMSVGCNSGNSLRMTSLNSSGNGVSFCTLNAGVTIQGSFQLSVHTFAAQCHLHIALLCSIREAFPERLRTRCVLTLRKHGGLSTSVVNSLTLPLSTGLPAAAMTPSGRSCFGYHATV